MTRFGSYLATAALLLGGLGLAACSDDSDTAPLAPSAIDAASPAAGTASGPVSGAAPGSAAALPGVRSVAPGAADHPTRRDYPSAYQFSLSHDAGELRVTLINDNWDSIDTSQHAASAHGRTRSVSVYHCRAEPTSVWTSDESAAQPCGGSLLSRTSVAFPRLSRDLPFTLPPIDLPACTGWVVVWLNELRGDRANGWRNEPCPPAGGTAAGPAPGGSGDAASSGSSGSSGPSGSSGSDTIALQLGGGLSVFTVAAGGGTVSGFNLYTVNPDDYLELTVTRLPAGRSLGDEISGSQSSHGLWAYHRFGNNRRYGVGEWARGGLSVGGNVPVGIACGDYVVPYKVIRHPTGNPEDGPGEQRRGSFVVRVVSTPEADHCSGRAPGAASGSDDMPVTPIALQRDRRGRLTGDLRITLTLAEGVDTRVSGVRLRTVNPDDFLVIQDMSDFPGGLSRNEAGVSGPGLRGYYISGDSRAGLYNEGDLARGGLDIGGTFAAEFRSQANRATNCVAYDVPFTVTRRTPGSPDNSRSGTITVTIVCPT